MVVKLKDILLIKNGKDYKHLNTGNIPLIGTGGIIGYVDSYLYNKESILLPRKGTLNNIMYIDSPFWTVDTMFYAIPNTKKVNSKFLYYYLSLIDFTQYDLGSTIPSMTASLYYTFEINLPSLEEQNKIAKILSNIDDQIERNNAMVKRLQDLAQTTYSRWFNQFEFPNEEGKPYKSSGGKLIYNEKLKKEIPIDWAVDKLQKIAESKLGGTPNRSNIKYWNNGDIFWINSGEVNNFPIIDTEEKITQEGLINSATKLLPKKSIVISITGNIRFSIIGINCSTNQSVIGIIENKIFKTPYLYFALKDFQNIFESKMVGAVQKHINKEIIDTTEILIPPINILERYYKITENIFNQIFEISFKTKELLNLKNQLLPLLINGQLI